MRYVIGDIHGGVKTFKALLDKLSLRQEDHLYLLGDYIDRGPDSKGVLDLILQLNEGGYDLHPVRGNHEDMLLQAISGNSDYYLKYWLDGWGTETLKSFAVTSPEELPARYLTFLERTPCVYYDEDFIFVHAGLDMTTEDPLAESSTISMMWNGTGPLGDDRLQGRTLVTGHYIRPLSLIELSLQTNHYQLDNGAFTNTQPDFGNLVVLNLDSKELIIQPWCDGKVLV